LPLSQQAAGQLEEIETMLGDRDWDENTQDAWSYSWGNSKYSSKKVYNLLMGSSEVSPLFSWLWASCTLGKHKFFFWLLIRDRLNTRNLLRRKNMDIDDYSCVLCNGGHEETSFHLFFECSFSQSCWSSIPITWNLNLPSLGMVIDARSSFGNVIFREIFITACWVIWTSRNAVIFDNAQADINLWKRNFREELGQVCTKAKPSKQVLLNSWRDSFIV